MSTHRERLLEGMASAIREKGFVATTVADVVRHARVSRRTFYEHFEDRDACYFELHDRMSEAMLAAIADAAGRGGTIEERVDRATRVLLELVASDPAVTRSWIYEVHATGAAGVERTQAVNERFARQLVALVEDAAREDPRVTPVSLEVAAVVTGGFRELMMFALARGPLDVDALRTAYGAVVTAVVTASTASPPAREKESGMS